MSDPLALVSLALGAGAGRVGGHDAGRLVSAGHSLLQRCAPFVRSIAGRRTAAIVPVGPALLTAMAASDGRGMVLIDPATAGREQAAQMLQQHNVGAVFTLLRHDRLVHQLVSAGCPDLPIVFLDSVPAHAAVRIGGHTIAIDLGSHWGLELEGRHDVAGSDEECLLFNGVTLSHRAVLSMARQHAQDTMLSHADITEASGSLNSVHELIAGFIAPLLVGGEVRITTGSDADETARGDVTRAVDSAHDSQMGARPH